ncbi:hypothetical protein cypCar_00025673 [Cyprinus carpio]|nr:hypothetical protein cypCar_00025673 [Cyprinus carpio]
MPVRSITGHLFLGGVDVSTYTEVHKYGLLSMVGKHIGGVSFKGCLRNIRINYQRMGLPKALVTKDISVGCEPEKQLGPSTTSPLVITIDSENITDVLPGMDKRNFLLLKDLEVLKGGWAALEFKHIKINLEFRKLGIHQSLIMFWVEEQPVHGQLRLDVDPDLGESKVITKAMLFLETPSSRAVHYTVTSSPKHGILKRINLSNSSASNESIIEFTNQDISEERILRKIPMGELVLVVHEDNKPFEIVYTVKVAPTYGFLRISMLEEDHYCGSQENPIQSFSQGSSRLITEDELLITTNDFDDIYGNRTITYTVTSPPRFGSLIPLYKLFSVEVENITICVVNNTGLTLLQGQATVTLTFENLATVTNERDASIKYLVTSPPSHGSVMVMEEPVTHFDQQDLHTGRIFYNMTDLSSPQDCFEFMVFTSESNLTNQVVNITVKPLIHLGEHVRVPDGIPVKLRKDVLDATELASLSTNDPIFEILEPPKHGKLV